MIKIQNKIGLTLTELVVACMIMGVMMTGVAAFGLSTKSMHETTSKSTLLAAKLRSAMNFLAHDASLAVGDPTDSGIDVHKDIPQLRYQICFRHDRPGTPADYSDDTWICFLHGNSYDIHRYEIPAAIFPRNTYMWATCQSISCPEQLIISVSNTNLANMEFFDVVNDAQGRLAYIDLFVTSKYDKWATANPFDNPEMTMRTRVNPTMHTR